MKKILFAGVAVSALAAAAVETSEVRFAAPSVVAKEFALRGAFWAEFEIAEPGPHTVWIRYATPEDTRANANVRIVNATTRETVHWERYDFVHALPSERPYDKAPRTVVRKARTAWHGFDMDFETAGRYIVNIYPTEHGSAGKSAVETLGVWVTNKPELSRRKNPYGFSWNFAKALAPTNAPTLRAELPEGFEWARFHPLHARLNTGIEDKNRRFFAVLHQNGHVYGSDGCDVDLVNLGLVGFALGDAAGLCCGTGVKAGGKTDEEAYSNNVKVVQKVLADERRNARTVQWDISWEAAAPFFWGKTNVWPRYRGWLKEKYGDVAKLNATWRTDYRSFDEIVPPKNREQVLGKTAEPDLKLRGQLKANFIDYRAACADWHANEMKARALAAHDTDPEHRRITAAFSNLDLNSVTFSAWRASDFDVIIKKLMEGKATHFGYDAYASDDYIGMEIDEFSSFSDDTLTINCSETSTHTPDPTLAVRTYWTGIGKGLGMWATFQHQEQGWNVEFPKFGNTDARQTPRPKLAAISDAVRAVHQIEDLYMGAKKAYPAKPVAIYYSRTCNALQERGYGSIIEGAPDSVFHVYELLRACGTPVTFICDRQLRDGSNRLDRMAALFFVDARYVPADVVDTVAAWVRRGGHVFADAQPAIYGEHGYPQEKLLPLMGVKPVGGAFAPYDPDNLHVTEFVATDGRSIMFSGFGRQAVEPADATVRVALRGAKGEPVFLTRADGKGSWNYFAGYLGTIYGGSPDQYGWRDGHADASPCRFLEGWLAAAGVTPVADLSAVDPYVRRSLRFECPLVDRAGNAILNVENYSFRTVSGCKVAWNLPKGVKKPAKVLFLKAKTRKLEELKFEYADGRLACELPEFGPYAAVLSLAEAPSPLLSVELEGLPVASQAEAELPMVSTNATFTAKVKVINATDDDLRKGTVTLRLPYGWSYDRETAKVGSLDEGETSEEAVFRIHAPAWCSIPTVRPINFVYETKDGKKSMPTVQTVWWGKTR